ncbi:MAG TPA: hypothetical protein P5084_05825, partial [Paludibacter sp.]|nr:hypothetical protein [Paludibacter sp.]
GLSFTDDMFESLIVADAKTDRDENYRLTDPKLKSLFKLKSTNPAIDKGTAQTFIRLKPYYAIPFSGAKPDLGAKELVTGAWTFPTPDETQPEDSTVNPGNRPVGIKQVIVNVVTQFTISAGAKSTVWGPFSLVSAESAVFDFQAVGSSSGAAIIEFSKDNSNWEQVGTQAKNGSTSWVIGKIIDLSADTAPWGSTIYIRFNNNSTKDVNIKNLIITGTIYTINSTIDIENYSPLLYEKYYNFNGQEITNKTEGLFIRKSVFENGKIIIQKISRKNI